MTLAGLLDVALADPVLHRIADGDGDGRDDVTRALGAPVALRPFVVAALAVALERAGNGCPVLAVTATGREAEDLAAALRDFFPAEQIVVFPSWETLPHERLSPRPDTVGQRLAVLRRLQHPEPDDPAAGPVRVVVASVRSVLQPQVAGLGELTPLRLRAGDEADLSDVVEQLVSLSYTRVDMVDRRGEFAVRGGIVDVFPPTQEHPLRVEFFGDTVEEIRAFTVADQRSMPTDVSVALPAQSPSVLPAQSPSALPAQSPSALPAQRLWAPPCREMPLTAKVRDRARTLALAHPELAEICEPLAEGNPVEGMEALAPLLADEMRLFVEELPARAPVIACDPERIRRRAADLVRTSEEFLAASWTGAAEGAGAPIDLGGAAYRSIDDVRRVAEAAGHRWWTVSALTGDTELGEDSATVGAHAVAPYGTETDRAVADVARWSAEGTRVVLVFSGHGTAARAVEVLGDAGIGARQVESLDTAPVPGSVTVLTGGLNGGFTLPAQGLAVLTGAELAGRRGSSGGRAAPRMPSRRRQAVDPLQLQPGDYVVHTQHGVGRYVEMVRRTINGGDREYLILEYAPSKRNQPADRLFVPTDQLELLTRYVGGEAPTVDKLGGGDWAKRKGRARKAVRQIAAELIRLYSARVASPGHAFGPDTPWQRELEDAFPYTETPDQLAAIDEVKADMARAVPMDRVICGDVGYGKTEIAIRAAFKAVQDGKQVAVLVPTTLLAQQHFATFSERMAQFPVTVKVISRFNTAAEQRDVLAGITDGTVDVVIGTHRLLQSTTKFAELGLVIVDEEQRFGVEHKEYLKSLRTAVDVLTMSATPIPRTLEMSMTGIREMSTILTPPEERHPVLTYVGAYDEKQIVAAVRRELLRDGQVFYLHNRVSSIDRAAQRLRELVPEARIGIGHGQMHEDELEKVMLGFWNRDYDVLVCTTIVESGLDIPNANTLLVERSDLFGLSQLHQIRGRVGRSRERAYAYFLYPPERPMTETAHDRLVTIAQNTDLGAGMAVATKDLEIRGAGNLLGGEQSGHIAGVGFDLYVRMVGEAVAEFKNGGRPVQEESEVKVELPVDAHLPHTYIPGERLRLEMYRKLAAVGDAGVLEDIRAELADRYGPPPEPVTNLLAVAAFRVRARAAGLAEVSLQGNTVRFAPVSLPESAVMRVRRLFPSTLYKETVGTLAVPKPMTAAVGGKPVRDTALLDWCVGVLDAVAG